MTRNLKFYIAGLVIGFILALGIWYLITSKSANEECILFSAEKVGDTYYSDTQFALGLIFTMLGGIVFLGAGVDSI